MIHLTISRIEDNDAADSITTHTVKFDTELRANDDDASEVLTDLIPDAAVFVYHAGTALSPLDEFYTIADLSQMHSLPLEENKEGASFFRSATCTIVFNSPEEVETGIEMVCESLRSLAANANASYRLDGEPTEYIF